MPDNSEIAKRMKSFELAEAGRMLMSGLPAVVRLDGRSFHSYTKGLNRPYDSRFCNLMVELTRRLVEETNACVGYHQSDEISLILYSSSYESQIYFNGRIQKITSVLASFAGAHFNKLAIQYLPETHHKKIGLFDCRVFNVPTKVEATNCIVWREQDATKNSIQMAAQSLFSHNELMNKNGRDMQEMLFTLKKVNWNDYPNFFKRGSYVQRKHVERKFTADEINNLPARHEARTNPDLIVRRTDYIVLDLPPITQVTNRVEVFFDGAEPQWK